MKTYYLILFFLCFYISNLFPQTWSSLGPGLNGEVHVILPFENDLYVGGDFTDAGGDSNADYLARWDGHQWHSVFGGINGPVYALHFNSDGILFIGGAFTQPFKWILHFDSNNLSGSAIEGPVHQLIQTYDNGLIAAGDFPDEIAVYDADSSRWFPLGGGLNDNVHDFAVLAGDLYVVGEFTQTGIGQPLDKVARWDGAQWHNIGLPASISIVADLLVHEDEIYIAGTKHGDCHEPRPEPLARWNGSSYEQLNWGLGGCRSIDNISIFNDALLADANDYISTDEGVFWYDLIEEQWNTYITGFFSNDNIHTMVSTEDYFYVGGSFTDQHSANGDNIIRWGQSATSTGDQPVKENSLSISPNPGSDLIIYNSMYLNGEKHTLRLTDISGQIVLKKETNSNQLNIAHLPSGIYFLTVESGGKLEMEKFVKI